MILIVAPRGDLHARCVAQDLERMGRPFRVVDSSSLTTSGRLTFTVGGGTWTCTEGEPVPLESVRTVWHRRRPPPRPAELAASAEELVGREWTELIGGALSSMDAFFVNDPRRQEAAVKPLQLRRAHEVGLRVPDTLVTNDPVAAAAFVDRHGGRVIHKALAAPRHCFRATQRWSESDRAALPELVLAPCIFQELVTNCRELRITVVGERVLAAEFRPRDGVIDGRLDVRTAYRPHSLPEEVSRRLLALVRRLGLVFSTVDMKVTDEGEYVFLELNPMGQFLYVEVLAGLPLTAAVAELLAGHAGHWS
jgi:hypothetical protein